MQAHNACIHSEQAHIACTRCVLAQQAHMSYTSYASSTAAQALHTSLNMYAISACTLNMHAHIAAAHQLGPDPGTGLGSGPFNSYI